MLILFILLNSLSRCWHYWSCWRWVLENELLLPSLRQCKNMLCLWAPFTIGKNAPVRENGSLILGNSPIKIAQNTNILAEQSIFYPNGSVPLEIKALLWLFQRIQHDYGQVQRNWRVTPSAADIIKHYEGRLRTDFQLAQVSLFRFSFWRL